MNHAPRCDCDECLPGVPVAHKPRKRITRPDPRAPFKRGNPQLKAALTRLRRRAAEMSGLAVVRDE